MTGSKFVEAEGFARYWQDKESKGILVPEAVLKAVQAEAKAKAQDMTAQAATKESAPQPKHGGPPCQKSAFIPIGTFPTLWRTHKNCSRA